MIITLEDVSSHLHYSHILNITIRYQKFKWKKRNTYSIQTLMSSRMIIVQMDGRTSYSLKGRILNITKQYYIWSLRKHTNTEATVSPATNFSPWSVDTAIHTDLALFIESAVISNQIVTSIWNEMTGALVSLQINFQLTIDVFKMCLCIGKTF